MKALLLILMLSMSAHAEIYKWVDENGKVHFGDKVPEQYQQEANNVDVNIRQPTEDEIAEAQERNKQLKQSRMKIESSQRSSRSSGSSSRSSSSGSQNGDMAAYRSSQACYAACAVTMPKAPVRRTLPDGTSYTVPGGTYRDLSRCGHCTNVKKPSTR